MTNVINVGVTSIDSFKLRLQVSKLESYDSSLNDFYITINQTTGEVSEAFKKQSKKYLKEHYSYYASYNPNTRVSNTDYVDTITILINSKQLKQNYFEGITNATIKDIYNEIIELGIITCTFKYFMNGIPTDIDFKKDCIVELDEYKEVINGCSIMTKPSSSRDKGCRVFKENDNYGIEWSVRKSTSYINNPFLKIYSKCMELMKPTDKGGANDFYNAYLKHLNVKDIIRIETTVKNHKHLETLELGLKNYTLKEILNLTDVQKNKIISKSVNAHLSSRTRVRTFTDKTNMTPSNRLLLNSILVQTTELNWSITKVENIMLTGIENKVSKSRTKKLINTLYNDYIHNTDYDFKRSKVNEFFDQMNWF